MGKRGRPPYPGILTPREWEVLELLREGLSNPAIAERLRISRDGAKYHVSEILSKLGLESRDEAARWQPAEARPWWAAAFAPLLPAWKKLSGAFQGAAGVAARAVAIGVLAVAAGGLGLVGVLLYVQNASDGSDTSSSVAPTDVREVPEDSPERLEEVPGVTAVMSAIDNRDTDALLRLMDWQPQACGSPHGSTDACPGGVAAGTELPMINTADVGPYWLREATVRQQIIELFGGDHLELRFAARTDASPYLGQRTPKGDVYMLGFEGAPREVSSWGSLTTLTGVFLNLDSGSDRPIISLSPLAPDWSATQQAGLIEDALMGEGHEAHEIIVITERQSGD